MLHTTCVYELLQCKMGVVTELCKSYVIGKKKMFLTKNHIHYYKYIPTSLKYKRLLNGFLHKTRLRGDWYLTYFLMSQLNP